MLTSIHDVEFREAVDALEEKARARVFSGIVLAWDQPEGVDFAATRPH